MHKQIYTRTPFYTQYTSTEDVVTLELRVWAGSESNKPVTPSYTLSRTASGEAFTFEIAELINDYIEQDIEGAEDRALLGFPFDEYVFNCITIERPSDKLRSLLKDHQYILIKEMPGLDCFYIHKSFRSKYIKNYFAYGEKKFRTRRWA